MAFFSRLFRYLRDTRIEACNSSGIRKRRNKKRKKEIPLVLCFVKSSKRKKKKKKSRCVSTPNIDPSATGPRQITISVHNAQNGQMDLITF